MESLKFVAYGHIPLYPMYIMLKNPVHTTKVLNAMYTDIQSAVKKLQKEGYVLKCEVEIENPKTGYDKYKNLSFKVTVKDAPNLSDKMMDWMLSCIEDGDNIDYDYSEWKEYLNDDGFLTELFVKSVEAIDIPRGYQIMPHINRHLKAEVLDENGNTYLDALFAKIMVRYVARLKKSLVKDGSDLNDLVKLSGRNLHKLYKGKEIKYTLYLEQFEYVMLS